MAAALSSMLLVARTTTLSPVALPWTQLLGPIRSLILVTGLRHRTLIVEAFRSFPHNTATDKPLQRP
jgi:hypothetical protein